MQNFKNRYFLLFIITLFFLSVAVNADAQGDTLKYEGVKVIVPPKEVNTGNTYFIFSGGYQLPSWYRVPMIPVNQGNVQYRGNIEAKVPGWFTGIGVIKRTRSNFEVGILADYFQNTIPVALSGESSTSEWVFEQPGSTSNITEVFLYDIDRINQVISVRATIRYKIPLGKFQVWGGLAPGTFSTKIYFAESNRNESSHEYLETFLGLSYQAGIDLLIKNKEGENMFKIGILSDFSGPRVEEKFISLFYPGWIYSNKEGNNVVNPVRLGLVVGLF